MNLNDIGGKPTFLVIQLARFGDLVQTKRLILSLLGQGQVHLLVDRSLVPLARIVYPRVEVHGLAAHGTHGAINLGTMYEDISPLSSLRFTRIYNLNFSRLNVALAGLFPSHDVRGYRMNQGQQLIDSWPDLVMRWTANRVSAGLNLVDVWGMYADQVVSPEQVNPAARPHGGGVGVVMAGQNARRSLPPQILAALVQAAVNRVGHGPVYLFGTASERRAAKDLAAHLPAVLRAEIRDLVGKTRWHELADSVGGLDLLLSPDTGTMHLAAHLGVPVLAFFLSSAWCHETGPYGEGHLVLQAVPECAPCLENEACGYDIRCRSSFSESAVLRCVSGRVDKGIASGCALMHSGFDDLGLVWTSVVGDDPHCDIRSAHRRTIAAVAGVQTLPLGGGSMDAGWMRERDWMLPQTLRGRVDE